MDKGTSIKRNADGSFSITGSSYVTNTKQDDIILLKIDQYGNELWFKKFGSSATDWGANLVIDSNNDNIITGEYSGHIFMARIDQNGNYK